MALLEYFAVDINKFIQLRAFCKRWTSQISKGLMKLLTVRHYIHTHPMYEIKFEDAIGKDSHTIVQIFNKTNKDIAYKVNFPLSHHFKIRTTHPKQFVVQPNQYILRPETNMKVDFHMLPSVIFLLAYVI